MPDRIQLRRTKGWRKPEGAVVVARPSRWGNPFTVDGRLVRDRAQAVDLYYHALIHGQLEVVPLEVRRELAGRDLACWCPLDQPCHSDVLLSISNRGDDDE